jgi:hypothetical protein
LQSFPRHISLYREITNVEILKPDLEASNQPLKVSM